VLNEAGRVEMDAAIMDGRGLEAGAVAALSNIANPIRLARLVLTDARHLMYVADGALRFAERHGVARVTDDYFMTAERLLEFEKAQKPDFEAPAHNAPDKHGTIGAVARDLAGNLAAATSTGGTTAKALGRVGDSPIIGAGVWADDATCAVSCTGTGEAFMRTVLAKTMADHMELLGLDGPTAADAGLDYLVRRAQGRGGFILVDHDGRCSARFTTRRMIHGWIERGGETQCRL
jgi:beta-aspartyl-peptidase (threonine type)